MKTKKVKFLALTLSLFILITTAVSAEISYTGKQLETVPQIYQLPELPWGCEATALAGLANYYGYKFTKQEIWDNTPKMQFEVRNGRLYAEHPDVSMAMTSGGVGYGIFAPAVEKILNKMIQSAKGEHKAVNLSGCSEEELFQNLPKVVWVTGKMKPTELGKSKWYLKKDGEYTDEIFLWPGNEHAMVLLSATKDTVKMMDPISGTVDYPRDAFLREWKNQGKQVIAFEKLITYNVYINNYKVNFKDEKPALIDDKLYVPVKTVFKMLGMGVYYDEDLREVWIARGEEFLLRLKSKSSHATIDGVRTKVDVPARIENNTFMVDIDFLISIQSLFWCKISYEIIK